MEVPFFMDVELEGYSEPDLLTIVPRHEPKLLSPSWVNAPGLPGNRF